jgi:hypothetical protein
MGLATVIDNIHRKFFKDRQQASDMVCVRWVETSTSMLILFPGMLPQSVLIDSRHHQHACRIPDGWSLLAHVEEMRFDRAIR